MRVCSGCFTKRPRGRQSVARTLGHFRVGVGCSCIPKVIRFVTSLHQRNIGVTLIADSGATGVRGICRTRPRFGSLFSRVLATRHFGHSGPSPRYFLLKVAVFNSSSGSSCIFRSSFRNLRTNESSKTVIIKLTAAGSHRTVTSGTSCMVSSFEKVACRGLLAVASHCV